MDQETMNIFKKYINKSPDNKYNLIFYSDSSKYKVISNRNANKLLKKKFLMI